MDWKYIISLNFDDLSDEEKDDLYSSITWYDFEDDDIDLKRCKVIFKVSQELLKYKGEQVETLLHELEEMAIKQAEDEAKKMESETEARSIRSKRSSMLEFENLEQNYIELKGKYKKVTRNNEKNELEIQKLNKRIRALEQENRSLQNEIQSMPHEIGSESDISETVRDQQRELVQTVHNKNKQISDLLRDIEEVENENFVLRDKLIKVRDELSVATKEITSLTNTLEVKEITLKEYLDKLANLEGNMERINNENLNLQEEKNETEEKFKVFSININKEIEELKGLCNSKNLEIKELRSKLNEKSVNSSIPSLPKDENDNAPHICALQKALSERDKQLLDVKTQLQDATKEMKESTGVIKKLRQEKEDNEKNLIELTATLKEMKKQLSAVHERCRNLQSDISFQEKIITEKDTELQEILGKLTTCGQDDLAKSFKKIHQLRTEIRLKEKQITDLVKATNKLQDINEFLEKENCVFREKLGISDEERVNFCGYESKEKRRQREIELLKVKIRKFEEQNIDLKSEIHKLNQVNASLSNQLLDLGQKPSHDYTTTFDIDRAHSDKARKLLAEENKNLVEENEALRMGMHDILDSINTRKVQTLNEIKSDTLEKLLRALDVKHISGWYHPAMRLQAEVHNIEGINSELREQLRNTKIELLKYKSFEDTSTGIDNIVDEGSVEKKSIVPDAKDEDGMKSITCLSQERVKDCLERLLKEDIPDFSVINIKDLRFSVKRIIETEDDLRKQLLAREDYIHSIEEELKILEAKFKVLTEAETDEEKLKKIDEIVTSNVKLSRKVTFLGNQTETYKKTIDKLKKNLNEAEVTIIQNNEELKRKQISLENSQIHLKNVQEFCVNEEQYKTLEKKFDDLTVKYREQCYKLKKQQEDKSLELQMLQETKQFLELDNEELKSKLVAVSSKLFIQTVQRVDDNLQKLAENLASSEINEMTERQRANHTNNLYQLVKEQLSKSEERFQEYSKYNEDLLKKNLILQEQLKDAEEKLIEFVDKKILNQSELDKKVLLKENEELKLNLSKLKEDLMVKEKKIVDKKTWNDTKEQELLNLKHQIVDLISVSDEKVIIAQLNNDIFQCRQSLNYYKTKNKEGQDALQTIRCDFEEYQKKLEKERTLATENEAALTEKNMVLKNLLNKQKTQYLGCIPLWCEESYLNILGIINKEKHETFLKLHEAKLIENEAALLKEQLQIEINSVKQQKQILNEGAKNEVKNVLKWMQEKKTLQINELRYKRQSAFKEKQIDHFMERIEIQDEQITKLEEELLLWQKNFDMISLPRDTLAFEVPLMVSKPTSPIAKTTQNSISTQTIEAFKIVDNITEIDKNQSAELLTIKQELTEKQKIISQLKTKISEQEMTISLFRTQIGDKQSQISFYEKHILELQNKKAVGIHSNGAGGDNITIGVTQAAPNNEELLTLKASMKSLQENLKIKEEEIMKYQTLLKVDRDKHSLAAANLQEELKTLQKQLLEEKQKNVKLEECFAQSRPNRAAIDQYVGQVHTLEKHTAELHTKISSLEAQLQSSRQEAVRWRTLANDRLTAMEELRRSLEEQHRNELMIYKTDSEKFKELTNDETNNLKQLLDRHRVRCTGRIDIDIQKLISEKDEKINEMATRLRQMKMGDLKKTGSSDTELSPKLTDLETSLDMLHKENEILKKRCEQLLSKEKAARDEIRDLKAQLLRKPSSIRNDKADKNIKDQLQKKVTTLENEVESLKSALNEQLSINETHKIQASQDFDKWKKMKHWQQTADKLKNKLKEKEVEFEKLQQTSVSHRMLIERLEREKHNLENRIKTLKASQVNTDGARELEILKIENMKLLEDLRNLNSKLEMQQHHSGALGAAMMQEKLESQERKIAILELTAKGTTEIRAEMERLQLAVTNLQKNNLKLETENLDLKLDLEKARKDVPELQQRIQHLESHIEILNSQQPNVSNVESEILQEETKKVEELERTVFIMKRVVEKLQAENKRLLNTKRPTSGRSSSTEKQKSEIAHLREQHAESIRKIKHLEQELLSSTSQLKNVSTLKKSDGKLTALTDELKTVKEQLEQKSMLLDKVKVLLHRAAAKEKLLMQEISELKTHKDGAISPITEETESSSDV